MTDVEIWGGPGSVSAELADLETAANGIRLAAEHLATAAEWCQTAFRQFGLLPHLINPCPWVTSNQASPEAERMARLAAEAIDEATFGMVSPGRLVAEIERLAADLDRAVAEYAAADAAARAALSSAFVQTSVQLLATFLPPHLKAAAIFATFTAWLATAQLGGQMGLGSSRIEVLQRDREISEYIETYGMSLLGSLLLPGAALVPNDKELGILARPLAIITNELTGSDSFVVTEVGEHVTQPTTSLADAFGLLYELRPDQGGAAGAVAVERFAHPDGTIAWLVALPATQEVFRNAPDNVIDVPALLNLEAGMTAAPMLLAAGALAAAGARSDEKVLLVGHSQGGMVGVRLAEDRTFTDRFSVVGVVTAGSPVAAWDLPTEIQGVHFEHSQDVVVALDGQAVPPEPNRTTIRVDMTTQASALASTENGHSNIAYQNTAAETFDTMDDPSLVALRELFGEVWGPEGTTSQVTVYQGAWVPREA